MRSMIILGSIALLTACSGKSIPNNGNGGSGGSGNGTSDMSINGTGGNGAGSDMTANTPACDVSTQTGCPMGDKCVPTFSGGGGNIGSTCVAGGTVADGMPCTPTQSGGTINDNCVAGEICDNDGPGSTNVCRKICTSDKNCATGDRCGDLLGASYGACLPTCTAFGAGCPAGNDCSVPFDDIDATQTTEDGFFVCKKTGTGALWTQCQADSDCAAGLACDQQAGCYPICDNNHACGDAPGDGGVMMCNPLSSQPNGAGYCN